MTTRTISWSHGEVEVVTTAAMIVRCVLTVDGAVFEPLARAPWLDEDHTADADFGALPGHLRVLGGEFVCVPFGVGGAASGAVDEWRDLIGRSANTPEHGLSADLEWDVAEERPGGLTLRLKYPDDHLIDYLERRIDGVDGEPALRLSLTLVPRRTGQVAVGLHPIIRLPEAPGSVRIDAEFAFGLTYPAYLEPGVTRTERGAEFSRLDEVPGAAGSVDFSRLPFTEDAEEVLLLCGARSPVSVEFLGERIAFDVEWDADALPSAQLWLSDRALDAGPWGGRYRGLGVEPIAAAFDFADDVSTAVNPISERGVRTSVSLDGGQARTIEYALRARRI